MHIQAQNPDHDYQSEVDRDDRPVENMASEPPSPWARRALIFLQACVQIGVGALTLDDLGPMFALAPRGELALTVDALCALDCLVPQEDGSFRVGPAVPELAPRPSRYASAGGRLGEGYAIRRLAGVAHA